MGRVLPRHFWEEALYLEQREKYPAKAEWLGFGSKHFDSTVLMSSPNHRISMSEAGFCGYELH